LVAPMASMAATRVSVTTAADRPDTCRGLALRIGALL
jgi:hypothetical protein